MRRWRWWLVAFVVAIAFFALLRWHAAQNSPVVRVQRELERLRKMGEPLSYHDLLPPVPKHLDRTPIYRKAFALLPKLSINEKMARDAFASGKPANITLVRQLLARCQPSLALVRQAVKLPHVRLTQWQPNPFATQFPHYSHFRELARWFAASSMWCKWKGDVDGSVEGCIVTFRLARRMGDEPSLTGFLVQLAIFAISERALWRVLADTDASPQSYRQLLTELQAGDIDKDLVRALQMDRAILGIGFFEGALKRASIQELHNFG